MAESNRFSVWNMFSIEDTRTVALECIRASRALAELKGMLEAANVPGSVPDFIRLCEAGAGFSLEGPSVDIGEVLKAATSKEGDFPQEVRDVVRYADVLKGQVAFIPSAGLLENLCSGIVGVKTQLRKEDSTAIGDADRAYTAPKGSSVANLTEELLDFVNGEYVTDELITAVVAHLIFESIRPFEDGNVRTGMAFIHILLNRYGLTDGCEIMVCPSILKNRDEYHAQIFKSEKTGNTEDWIVFMLRMVREGAQDTMGKVHAARLSYNEVRDRIEDLPFFSEELMRVLFANTFVKNADLISAGLAERVTAMKYLRTLEDRGILKSEKVGREILFRNVLLYDALLNGM